ncbi:MAG: hypothetical protein WCK65_09080 [Rhodospirillaceae bacterium]
MTPENLASLIGRRGPALDRAQTLETILRFEDDPSVTPDRVNQIIARTLTAAHRTPQLAPPALINPPASINPRAWLARLVTVIAADGLWRFCLPAAVALVLGVVVGHATLDPTTAGKSPADFESLLSQFQPREPFGL